MKNEQKTYLILNNKSLHNHFEGIKISEGEFLRYTDNNFHDLKILALQKNMKIFIIEVTEPIIKIIPEATVIINK